MAVLGPHCCVGCSLVNVRGLLVVVAFLHLFKKVALVPGTWTGSGYRDYMFYIS